MDIDDLNAFLAVARTGSLQHAARELSLTPSALSKAVKRLEVLLGCTVFDRIGKTLKLNAAGERLRVKGGELTRLAGEIRAEFRGTESGVLCRVVAPAVLQWRYAGEFAARLSARFPASGIAFERMYEQDAISAVARGDADFALVTRFAVEQGLPARLEARSLGMIQMQLACGATHPLVAQAEPLSDRTHGVTTAQVLQYDFACPNRSPFCGIERGTRADGWRDDMLPRRVRYWLEDMQVLIALVRQGQALAYLPDFALQDERLARLNVRDCPYHCEEEAMLVWQPDRAHGWHQYMADLAA
ncbi:MAG: LysR family transcriptional regulator [Burkholderiales bacterium]|nr:LysR family transcriptional regulator [Burkholderiales bacterium]